MTVLKSEIYTNKLLTFKKFFLPKFKKLSLLIINCLINLVRKLNKDQKPPLRKFEKKTF